MATIEVVGIDTPHHCGGRCRYTTCRCDIERARLAREEALAPTVRLTCPILARDDPRCG